MECKVSPFPDVPAVWYGINRNIVECKAKYYVDMKSRLDVLIETLWNVKTQNKAIPRKAGMVLIETLWNVKIRIRCSRSAVSAY